MGLEVEPRPFQGMTLREVMGAMLGERPMTATELVVAMLEAGYETTMTPRAFRTAVGAELRKTFRKRGEKWESP